MTVVSLNERRKYPRISDALALCLDSDRTEPLNPTPTHVVKMSCGGLRFTHNASIDTETSIRLCMHLTSSDQTVHIASRVISSGEEKCGEFSTSRDKKYYVQVEFLDVDHDVHQLLEDHINYVLGKTGLTNRAAVPA